MKKFAAAALWSMVLTLVFAAPAFAAQHHVKHPKAVHAKNPYLKHHVKHHVAHPPKHHHHLWPFHKR